LAKQQDARPLRVPSVSQVSRQHTAAVFREVLGYDESMLEASSQ
jgi:hypothetical protein